MFSTREVSYLSRMLLKGSHDDDDDDDDDKSCCKFNSTLGSFCYTKFENCMIPHSLNSEPIFLGNFLNVLMKSFICPIRFQS